MFLQDGKNVEIAFLGKAMVRWDGEYRPYREAMDEVRRFQPGDPSDPECRFANDFHAMVALELGLEDWSELKFYTAVGSPLDFYHGVDGFFEFCGKVVTIDGTTNPEKLDAKANYVVNFGWSHAELQTGAGQIAHALR